MGMAGRRTNFNEIEGTMSKTAEEITQYVLKNMGEHHTVAKRVIADLRVAGLLREPNDGACQVVCERDERLRQIAQLERDLSIANVAADGYRAEVARLERDLAAARTRAQVAEDDALHLRLNAVSPAVQRVVDAAKQFRREVGPHGPCAIAGRRALDAALDALAAVERKAEPKPPRFYVDGNEVRERTGYGTAVYSAHYGCDAVGRAFREADRLNSLNAEAK